MKNNLLWIIALVAVIGFGITGCGSDSDDEKATYTVTFESNGGTTVTQKTVTSEGTISAPAEPTKFGYAFDDWYSDSALTIVYDFDDPITSNITLYAKWSFDSTGIIIGIEGPGGGKIFHIDSSGFTLFMDANDTIGEIAHYLEAAPADIPEEKYWSITDYGVSTVYNTIGTGKKNTYLMIAGGDAPAAQACIDYINNGKADWFLPNLGEFGKIRDSGCIDGLLSMGNYWTSSQSDIEYAWIDNNGVSNKSTVTKNVRPIRAF